MKAKLNRLDHAVIRVGELAANRRWYEEIIGLKTLETGTDRAHLSADGETLDLVLVAGGTGAESLALGIDDERDFDAYQELLERAGTEVVRTDGQGRPGISALLRHPLPERGVTFEVALADGRATGLTQTAWDGASPFPTDIDHVNLAVGDVQASSVHVRDLLGLSLTDVCKPADDWILTFLRTQDLHHEVGFVGLPDPASLHHIAFWMAPGGEHHRIFADHLAAHGQTMEWPGICRHGGPSNNIIIYLFDPSGNRIEMCAEMGVLTPDWETVFWGAEDVPQIINQWQVGWAPETFLTVGS